jgi:hypothetical protein
MISMIPQILEFMLIQGIQQAIKHGGKDGVWKAADLKEETKKVLSKNWGKITSPITSSLYNGAMICLGAWILILITFHGITYFLVRRYYGESPQDCRPSKDINIR